jgi:hypothetical protein
MLIIFSFKLRDHGHYVVQVFVMKYCRHSHGNLQFICTYVDVICVFEIVSSEATVLFYSVISKGKER